MSIALKEGYERTEVVGMSEMWAHLGEPADEGWDQGVPEVQDSILGHTEEGKVGKWRGYLEKMRLTSHAA